MQVQLSHKEYLSSLLRLDIRLVYHMKGKQSSLLMLRIKLECAHLAHKGFPRWFTNSFLKVHNI